MPGAQVPRNFLQDPAVVVCRYADIVSRSGTPPPDAGLGAVAGPTAAARATARGVAAMEQSAAAPPSSCLCQPTDMTDHLRKRWEVKLVFPDEQALLLGDTGWFPGALGYRFIFEASTQNVERYVLLDTMPQASLVYMQHVWRPDRKLAKTGKKAAEGPDKTAVAGWSKGFPVRDSETSSETETSDSQNDEDPIAAPHRRRIPLPYFYKKKKPPKKQRPGIIERPVRWETVDFMLPPLGPGLILSTLLSLEAWDRSPVPVPLSLRLLWVVAADPFIVCFRARQLVLASRLAAAEDLQDLELPDEVAVEDSASLVLEWWDRWLRSVLSNPAGWAFCREALRQALNWQRLLQRKRLPDEVPKAAAAKVLQAVVQRLGMGLDKVEVPTQLLLELLEVEESGLEEKLAEELTRRIQASLCEGPLIPMSTAVALANGNTPIPCPRGSLLWSGLVASIAAQLKSKRQVDDFGACRPRPDIWDAVAQLKTGSWQSLELKLRRPFS
eukprot:s440_g16.t3